MSVRVIVLVLFALGAAAGTVYFAQSWMAAQRAAMTTEPAKPAPKKPETQVLTAAETMPTGTFVKPEHLRWQAWPDDNLAPAYMVKGEHEPTELVGAVVRDGITAGEPMTEARVVKPGERGFLAAVLTPGMRAVSVSVDATAGVAGFVFPGDYVDLILTHKIGEEDAEGKKVVRRGSETVLTGVRVLAIDQTVDDVEGEPKVAKNATLEVTPKQAEIIAVVTELGRLSLSLRALAREDQELREAEPGQPRKTWVAQRSYTWDSEASLLIKPPDSALNKTKVHVLRGEKAQVQEYRR